MPEAKVFKEDFETVPRLSQFNVTKNELLRVVELAAGGRADAVPNDPITAGGQFSYIYGTRGLREIFIPKGWEKDSTRGIESVIHPESRMKIIFQNVDLACDVARPPKAISGKGPASEQIIDESMGFLFGYLEKEYQKSLNRAVWFFCVSVREGEVMAELSLPLGIKGGQFNGFAERIFILKYGEWNPTAVVSSEADVYPMVQDYAVPISRK